MTTLRPKIVFNATIAAYTLSLVALPCVGSVVMPQPLWASAIAAPVGSVTFTPPPPPPDRDAPGQRVGAASRSCSFAKAPLVALVPEYEKVQAGHSSRNVWGTTLAERPTFWFDVPYERKDISTMVFSLEDESNAAQETYQSEIVPPDTPGIVSIHLPATVPPLKPGRLYHWTFSVGLRCGGLDARSVDGWIQRVNPDAALTNQLKQTTLQQRVALYAQKGIWFDTLTTLGDLRLANPQDTTWMANWASLLQSIGLQDVAKKPFVHCCEPK